MEAPMPPGMLTEEEERWLMAQMQEEEEEGSDDEDDEVDGVSRQRIKTSGGAGMEISDEMEAEMLHFLNATGQQTERSDHHTPAPGAASGPVEKRIDINDGNLYTRQDFQQFYGSLDAWNAAPPEKRFDSDEQPYTLHDFLSFYGDADGAKRWEASRPQAMCKNIQYGPCKYGVSCKYMHLDTAHADPHSGGSHNRTWCPPKQ